jgi:hypothetical protein
VHGVARVEQGADGGVGGEHRHAGRRSRRPGVRPRRFVGGRRLGLVGRPSAARPAWPRRWRGPRTRRGGRISAAASAEVSDRGPVGSYSWPTCRSSVRAATATSAMSSASRPAWAPGRPGAAARHRRLASARSARRGAALPADGRRLLLPLGADRPLGMTLDPMPGYLWFHVVTTGGALLEVDRDHARWLHPGDVVLARRPTAHPAQPAGRPRPGNPGAGAGAPQRPLRDPPPRRRHAHDPDLRRGPLRPSRGPQPGRHPAPTALHPGLRRAPRQPDAGGLPADGGRGQGLRPGGEAVIAA